MSRFVIAVPCAIVLLVCSAPRAAAQLGHVSVLAGAYVPASDFYQLRTAADEAKVARSAALGLGANFDIGRFRIGGAYATGATLTEGGVDNGRDIGDGSVLAAAASVVLRPLPRMLLFQPYLMAGAGLQRAHYSFRDDGALTTALSRSQSDPLLHIGIGTDIAVGGIAVVAEIVDFITWRDGALGEHDAFVMVGLRFGL